MTAWVPIVISAAALGLSGWSLYLQRRDRRPRIRVTVERRVEEFGRKHDPKTDSIAPGDEKPAIRVTVMNIGSIPATVEYPQIVPLIGRPSALINYAPRLLPPEASLTCSVPIDQLSAGVRTRPFQGLRITRFSSRDHRGTVWFSRWVWLG